MFPADNAAEVTGFVVVATSWLEMFNQIFPEVVSGVDVVVENSEGSVYTYTFEDGKPKMRGKGDHHDRQFDSYERRCDVVRNVDHAPDSTTYTLTFYPREEFFEDNSTDIPLHGTLAVVFVMLVTTVIFIVHDYFLKSESNQRQEIIDTKRKFVRFISHEIRTPLNTGECAHHLMLYVVYLANAC